MGACFEVRAHLYCISALVAAVRATANQQPGQPARRCTRRLQLEAVQLTRLVGTGTNAAVCEHVRLTWVRL